MGMRNKTSDDSSSGPNLGTAMILLKTVADTTWRLFVPTVGLTALGVTIDNVFDTKPWLSVVCVVVGAALSFMLVLQQLKKVKST